MCHLLETIQIRNGELRNISYHNKRFNSARKELFGINQSLQLENIIKVPEKMHTGTVKCRLIYGKKIEDIHFSPYQIMNIRFLHLIEANISYPYKFENRAEFDRLKKNFSDYDEILITKNGYITDTSFSNVIFLKQGKWYTPSNPLLKGTKRAKLLKNGIIKKCNIHRSQLKEYSHLMLINAMLDFDEKRKLLIQTIKEN